MGLSSDGLLALPCTDIRSPYSAITTPVSISTSVREMEVLWKDRVSTASGLLHTTGRYPRNGGSQTRAVTNIAGFQVQPVAMVLLFCCNGNHHRAHRVTTAWPSPVRRSEKCNTEIYYYYDYEKVPLDILRE